MYAWVDDCACARGSVLVVVVFAWGQWQHVCVCSMGRVYLFVCHLPGCESDGVDVVPAASPPVQVGVVFILVLVWPVCKLCVCVCCLEWV